MALDLNRGETAGNTSKGSDLDRYGVWVKKPPRTVEYTSTSTEEEPQEPSPIDDLESAAREETSGIDALMDTGIAVPPAATDGEDDTLLDTFIDADFLDDFTNDISTLDEIQEEDSVQAVVQPVPASQEGEIAVGNLLDDSDEVPLEDFMVSDLQEGDDILDESPIDMDLTFDDEFTLETEDENTDRGDGEEPPVAEARQDAPDQADSTTTEAGNEKTAEIQEACLDSLQVSDYTGAGLESDDDFDAEKITSEAENIGGNVCGDEPTAGETVQEHSGSDDAQTEKSQDDMIERPEEAMEFNQDGIEQPAGSRTEELISNIAREIALLRDEVANLKADFEAFKGGRSAAGPVAEPEIQEEASGGGFFADTEDDDTIALSGDELSNIFNTADFTEESVDASGQQPDEEPDNGLPPMNFDSEELEEPTIEDSALGAGDDGLPEEIDVPTEAAQQQEIFEEIELEEESTEELFDDMFEGFDFEEPPAGEAVQAQEASGDGESMAAHSEIEDGRTTEAAETIAEESVEVAEALEEEITDEPTEAVFESNQWEEAAGVVDSEEETADTTAFDDDSLVIEEVVDTVSDAEEELLEELAAEDGAEILQAETGDDDFVEPVVEDLPAVEPDMSDETATIVEMEAIDEPAVTDYGAGPEDSTEAELQADESDFVEPVVEDLPAVEPDMSDETATALEVEANDEAEAIDGPEAAVEPGDDVPEAAGSIAEDGAQATEEISEGLKSDIKAVLSYMDKLLDSLPEEKIAEFARSEHFELYKKLFTELGLS